MLQMTEAEPGLCARRMEDSARDLTATLEADNMELSAGKQQLLRLTRAARDAWAERGGTAVAVAKALGIHQYGYGHSHPELSNNIESFQAPARRIGSTGGLQASRCSIMGAILFGKCLYGAECHYSTERQCIRMPQAMCTAMGDKDGRRPDAGRLFVVGAGKRDPEVVRAKRLGKHWNEDASQHGITGESLQPLAGRAGKLGPISLMRHTLEKAGVVCNSWDRWDVFGGGFRPSADPSAATTFAEAVTASRWRKLAKHRSVLQGLHEGRGEETMLLIDRARGSPVPKGMLYIIQPDSIYT